MTSEAPLPSKSYNSKGNIRGDVASVSAEKASWNTGSASRTRATASSKSMDSACGNSSPDDSSSQTTRRFPRTESRCAGSVRFRSSTKLTVDSAGVPSARG